MLPTWVLSSIIVILGCIAACIVGSTLPEYNDYGGMPGRFGFVILAVALVVILVTVKTNFPRLLAIALWWPFYFPLAGFRNFPVIAVALVHIGLILFFRLCLSGTIQYIRSFNIFFLICFSWAAIRFGMNPVHKLGSSVEGGSGVSGAMPYFMYGVAAVLLLFLGAVLNSREKVFSFMLWTFRVVLLIGLFFFICAFVPATAPYIYPLGVYSAGYMGDGIVRYVQLPAYGIFLLQAALCPYLFRLKPIYSLLLAVLGMLMMIIGGNRSAILAAVVSVPVILLLRRSTHLLIITAVMAVMGIVALRVSVDQMSLSQVSPLVRSLGVFDSRIDKASGGDLSEDWRYSVWQSAIQNIMQKPLIGKGFGNLPKHLDFKSSDVLQSSDFEVILAGGEAHNGFLTAAYGFGIPFMAALTLGLFWRMFSMARSAFVVDKHDRELRDLYAFLTSMVPAFLVNIYCAFDLSVTLLWVYIALGIILDHIRRNPSTVDTAAVTQPQLSTMVAGPYAYAPGGKFVVKGK